jgi:nitroreductase
MDILEAITTRRSIRSFEARPVSKEVLQDLLLNCRWSPSGSNTQPWNLYVLGGEALEKVKRGLAGISGQAAHPDIPYPPMPEPYSGRQKALMQAMDAYLYPPGAEGVKEKRASQRLSPRQFFGAPNAILVTVNREVSPRAFLGLGMHAQTICLAALSYGLGTCIMSAAVFWPEIYRDLMKVPDSEIIAFAIALGYPRREESINNFPRVREPLESNVSWWGI